jgi:hypothetical protein
VRRASADGAASEVIGSLLLVALTASLGGGLVLYLVAASPGPSERLVADLHVALEPGACPWGTGDEVVTITHRGGETLAADLVRVRVTLNDLVLAPVSLASPLVVGGRWTSAPLVVADGAVAAVEVVQEGRDDQLVFSGIARALGACAGGA